MVKVFVVGHDWGANVAWHLCLFRPDRVKALVILGVPYFPRNPTVKPTNLFKALGEGFYITQFQVKIQQLFVCLHVFSFILI
jgi:pimeloyl-ACP methyl ester carboxylesterase